MFRGHNYALCYFTCARCNKQASRVTKKMADVEMKDAPPVQGPFLGASEKVVQHATEDVPVRVSTHKVHGDHFDSDDSPWPSRTDALCSFCDDKIVAIPCGRPVEYNKHLQRMKLEGRYCGWQCVYAEINNMNMSAVKRSDAITWTTIARLRSEIAARTAKGKSSVDEPGFNTVVAASGDARDITMQEIQPLFPSAPRQRMRPWGGPMTREEYREQNQKGRMEFQPHGLTLETLDIYVLAVDNQDYIKSKARIREAEDSQNVQIVRVPAEQHDALRDQPAPQEAPMVLVSKPDLAQAKRDDNGELIKRKAPTNKRKKISLLDVTGGEN